MSPCPHVTVTLVEDQVECVSCHTHEIPLTGSSQEFGKLLSLIGTIAATLEQAGMTDTAQVVKEQAERLIVNRQMVWRT